MEIEKSYNFKEIEPEIYKSWENSGYFNPDNLPGERTEAFSIVLPPPNVTGTLHMGHAAMLAIEDIIIRYQRMRGKKTLWLPGTDHAAIATQEKVEKELYKKEKKTRHDLGKEDFLALVKEFTEESHDTIVNQMKKMGSSVDWSREAFTLDDKRQLAVRTAFKRMYEAGLIYKGHRIVNWDPKLQTTVSDDEVDYLEQEADFYYIKYGPFTIATARPETKFGDKYVVMHPKDTRYSEYTHGQEIELEWINGPIKATVIKDEAIDMEFGTGVMTITPWHDMTDFEIANRHNLDKEQIIDYKGLLLPIAKDFSGMHIKKARPEIVKKLEEKGLLVKTEKYLQKIATNSRGGGIIEPQIMEQWFIDVNKPFEMKNSKIKSIPTGSKVTLKELLQTVIKGKDINIIPARFEKNYFHWINNLRDWCISRQIWYGHQIPVWYKGKEIHVDINQPEGEGWTQDSDTLDTWFSSGLWTFSTLGWPEQTKDLETFHPTNVLETGYDILFFWIARMILMTGFLLEEIPFKNAYLHGLVRDEKGKKMSKSIGNIIDPLVMAEKYGADATRLSLIIGTAPGNDMKLSEDKIKGYKHFSNKIWNATRFVLMNLEGYNQEEEVTYSKEDEVWLKQLAELKTEVTTLIEEYRFYLAGEKLYHYFWHTFADIIIEATKERLASDDKQVRQTAQHLLMSILTSNLKMLHPFMPYITESLWEKLPIKDKKQLIIEPW